MTDAPSSTPPRRRTWIDWPKAARLIAEGNHPEAVAGALGVSEEHVWRHLETSAHFRDLIAQARSRWQLLTAITNPARPGAAG